MDNNQKYINMKDLSPETISWMMNQIYENRVTKNVGKKIKYLIIDTRTYGIGTIEFSDKDCIIPRLPIIVGIDKTYYCLDKIDITSIEPVSEAEVILFKLKNDI